MKKLFCLVLALAMIFSLCACGEDNPSMDNDSHPESSSEPVATPEPEEQTFITENKLTYSGNTIRHYVSPTFQYLHEGEGQFLPNDLMTEFSISSLEVSEADDDGYITYSVTYRITTGFDYTYVGTSANENPVAGFVMLAPSFIDKYTGVKFPESEISGNEGFDLPTDIEHDGITYTICTGVSTEWSTGVMNRSYDIDTFTYEINQPYYTVYTIYAKVPAEYDGLCLAVDTRGATKKDDGETMPAHILGELEGEDLDNYVFCDLAALFREKDFIMNGLPAPEPAADVSDENFDTENAYEIYLTNYPEKFGYWQYPDAYFADDKDFLALIEDYFTLVYADKDASAVMEKILSDPIHFFDCRFDMYNTTEDKQLAAFLMDDQANILGSTGLVAPGECVDRIVCETPIAWRLNEVEQEGYYPYIDFEPQGLGTDPYIAIVVYSMDGEPLYADKLIALSGQPPTTLYFSSDGEFNGISFPHTYD